MNDNNKSETETLILLIEIHPIFWTQLQDNKTYLEQILIFCNLYSLLSVENDLIILGITPTDCLMIYTSESRDKSSMNQELPSIKILENFKEIAKNQLKIKNECVLSGAFSRALCILLRYEKSQKDNIYKKKQRILVLNVTNDVPSQYIPMMNAVFSAQRQDIVIDCFHFGSCHLHDGSSFMKQACYITNGIYLKPLLKSKLILHYLSFYFCTSPQIRKKLKIQVSHNVNFKANCFCHKNPIDMGYVCSICLSIFCKLINTCPMCGSMFYD